MNAVLRVDLEARLAIVVLDHLINTGRAIALRGFVVDRQVLPNGHFRVLQRQMDGLVFLVVGSGEVDR